MQNDTFQILAPYYDRIMIDISPAMVYTAKQLYPYISTLVGDMCYLPFKNSFKIISCLFDSINFLLDEEDIYRSIYSMASCLQENGIIYFDCVTEQMVQQYYSNSQWKENYKDFKTVWDSSYNPSTKTATLSILVQGKGWTVVRQKIYPTNVYLNAIKEAGLTLLASVDAHTWDHIDSGTVRIDFLCSKSPSEMLVHNFCQIHQKIKIESQLSLRND